jgi:hypothetical protein
MWKAIFQNIKLTIYKANLPSFVEKIIIKSRCYVDLSHRHQLKCHAKMAAWESLIGKPTWRMWCHVQTLYIPIDNSVGSVQNSILNSTQMHLQGNAYFIMIEVLQNVISMHYCTIILCSRQCISFINSEQANIVCSLHWRRMLGFSQWNEKPLQYKLIYIHSKAAIYKNISLKIDKVCNLKRKLQV